MQQSTDNPCVCLDSDYYVLGHGDTLVSSIASATTVTCQRSQCSSGHSADCHREYKWTATLGSVSGEVMLNQNGASLTVGGSQLCLLSPNANGAFFEATTQQSWDTATQLGIVGSDSSTSTWASTAAALRLQAEALGGTELHCAYTSTADTAVFGKGTGTILQRTGYTSDEAYIEACKTSCNEDPTCLAFVDDGTLTNPRCVLKTSSSGVSRAGKTLYVKSSSC